MPDGPDRPLIPAPVGGCRLSSASAQCRQLHSRPPDPPLSGPQSATAAVHPHAGSPRLPPTLTSPAWSHAKFRIAGVELAALRNRSQATVLAALIDCQIRLPYPLRGLDSDNGSEFINYDLKHFCEQEQITFTRCRPYQKNDQAYVEQKNWTAVRQLVGYERYEGDRACTALQALYHVVRLYLNFFQPVMVLVDKQRLGAQVKKRYDVPKTPYQRVLEAPEIDAATKVRLRQLYDTLNPAELLRQIQRRQAALWQLACAPAVPAVPGGTQVPPTPP